MIKSLRSCFLSAMVLCLCCATVGSVDSMPSRSGDESMKNGHSSRTVAEGAHSIASGQPQISMSTTVDPPSEITTSPRPLLIYIPFHVSEPSSHIEDLCDCTFRQQPWHEHGSMPFDILLSISGRASSGNENELQNKLDDAVSYISPRPRVFVEFVKLKSDRYVHDVDDEHKNDDWVGGPNTAFYDAMLDGHIFRKFVSHYKLVQQVETDVCALKKGWLDDLIKPANNGSVLISGATVKGDCIYVKKYDHCDMMQDTEDQMQNHVNGNALYRVGPELTSVLAQAKATFGNSEPFDLAIYWVMKARQMQARRR